MCSAKHNVAIIDGGKAWSHYGHAYSGSLWLYPEEAIFLMDIFALRVYYHKVVLSMQEAYHLFLNKEITIQHVFVFNYLSRLGYILIRYEEEAAKVEAKRKMDLESQEQCSTLSLKRRQLHVADGISHLQDLSSSAVETSCSVDFENTTKDSSDVLSSTDLNTSFDYSNIPFFIDNAYSVQTSDDTMEQEEATSVEPVMRTSFSCHTLLKLKSDSETTQQFHNWCEVRKEYRSPIKMEALESCDSTESITVTPPFCTYSLMSYRDTLAHSKARNWSQFKKLHGKRLRTKPDVVSNASSLVQESDCTSIPALMHKLTLSKTISLADLRSKQRKVVEEGVIFDVYNPNSKFKRKEPGTPVFRVRITSSFDAIPNMTTVCQTSTDVVPTYWAVCDGADISFYCFTQETIIPNYHPYEEKPVRRKNAGAATTIATIEEPSAT